MLSRLLQFRKASILITRTLSGIFTSFRLVQFYVSVDGVLYDKEMKSVRVCPGGKTGSVVLPESLTYIGYAAFRYCNSLEKLVFPVSGFVIEDGAFQGCEGRMVWVGAYDSAAKFYAQRLGLITRTLSGIFTSFRLVQF